MTFVDQTLEQMLLEINSHTQIFSEEIDKIDVSPYARKIAKKIGIEFEADDVDLDDPAQRIPFYIIRALILTYENSEERGKLPITTQIYQGNQGYVIRISDSGEGFDHKKMLLGFNQFLDEVDKQKLIAIDKARAAKKHYATNLGQGTQAIHLSTFECSYEGCGNTINMKLLIPKN
ncbi:hypothetical protein HN587_04710 [Candidatus Woesearchaeota archaeon]|jgi:hypothetical protein|nr:hypothetical protein [Candidatus Woesearchaeota archaeon]